MPLASHEASDSRIWPRTDHRLWVICPLSNPGRHVARLYATQGDPSTNREEETGEGPRRSLSREPSPRACGLGNSGHPRTVERVLLLRSYNAKALRASVPTLSLAVLLGAAALPARAQTLSSYDVDALPESKPTSSPPQIQCNSGELRSRRQRAISRRGGHAWQLLDQGLRDLAKHRASDESLTQHGTAKAAACGDKVEILDVVNGGHFDISAPWTKAWDQVEIFILDHAFDQTATHTP